MNIRLTASVSLLILAAVVGATCFVRGAPFLRNRPPMPIYIAPYYDSEGTKVSVGDYSKKLASADAKTILEICSELKKDKEKLRPEVMYVAAIRLYDLGQKDEAVYWLHTAQYRARLFASI